MLTVDAASDQLRGIWTDNCYPIGLFADSAQGKLYCLSECPPLVSVIDPLANKVLNTIVLSGYPNAMAFNNVDLKAYVVVEGYYGAPDAVVVLDAVGDTVLTEIPVGRAPDFMAYDADDDLLLAASYNSDCVLVVDGRTDTITDTVKVSEDCGGLVYNAARHRLYSLSRNDEVTVFAPRSHEQNNYISVGAELQQFALNQSGTRLYAANGDDNMIYIIDCVEESPAGVIVTAAPPVTLSYDSQSDLLYCAYGEEREGVSFTNYSRNSVSNIPCACVNSLYWDSGTDAVYCLGDRCLTVIDGASREVMTSTIMGGWLVGLATAPGWPRVYVADNENSYLTIVRTDTGPQVRAAPDAQATVVRGSVVWTGALAVMYDKCGRRVADVHRGGNDVSALRRGVYFIRQTGVPRGTFARKVVVTR
jgi:DNA-binding beta-propeller fold protein YncE